MTRCPAKLVGAALLIVALLGASQAAEAVPSAAVPSAAMSSPQAGPAPMLGVNTHLARLDLTHADTIDRQVQLARHLGARTIRLDIDWSILQPTGPNQYDSHYRHRLKLVFRAAAQAKLKVIGILLSTPCWASSAPSAERQHCVGAWWERGVSNYAPTKPRRYAAVAAWLVRHYGASMAALEVWNEPDFVGAGSNFLAPNPALTYTRILRSAYRAVKRADPLLPVLGGSLMNIDTDFLTAMWKDGAWGFYDGLSVHMYNITPTTPDWATANYRRTYDFQRLKQLHALMVATGRTTPVWVTELGVDATAAPTPGAVSSDQAASALSGTIADLATLPWVAAIDVYELRSEASVSAATPQWGLYSKSFQPSPAEAAVSKVFHAVLTQASQRR